MKIATHALSACALLLITCNDAGAQTETGSRQLLQRIHSATSDTSRINAWYAYALSLEDINLDSAAYYYRLGGELSRKKDYYNGMAHYAKNYSVVLNMQGKFDESMELNRSLLTLATARGHEEDIAKTLNNIASVFNHRGHYDSAYEYYLQSARRFEHLKNDRYLNIIYQNIAIVLDELKQYEKSLDYHRMALEKSRHQKDTGGIVSVMLNAAGTLNSLQRYDSSLVLCRQAYQLSKNINNRYYQHVALLTIGNIHAQQKKYDLALDHFNRSLQIAEEMQYPSGQFMALNGLAMTSFKVARYTDANKYAMLGQSLVKQELTFSENIQHLKLLADIKSKLDQPDSAFYYLSKYMTLQDSLTSLETKKHIAGLELKYQTALKDKSIAQQQLRILEKEEHIRTRNNLLMITIAVLVLVSAILLLSYYSFNARKKLLGQQVLTLQKEKEIETIRSAMEAREQERQRIGREMHDDLGAGLTALLYQVNSLKPAENGASNAPAIEKINETATTMISQMRDIVWAMNNEYDSVDDLLAYLRQQVGSQLSQAGVGYEFNTPEHIPDIVIRGEQRRNLYLSAKEAVHNIIKHAAASMVRIHVRVSDDLTIIITDNGKGMNGQKDRWGNGLKNMTARMKQAGGEFSIAPADPGTSVTLSLRLDT